MIVDTWVRGYRFAFGALAIWAVVWDFIDQNRHKPDFNPANFWSLFTFQSNIIAGVILILGAVLPAAFLHSERWNFVRGAGVMFMVTTGVVYATLLGGLFNPFDGSHSWMNAVLHQLTPIVMVVDLILQPPVTRLSYRKALIWTVYPLLFLVYSLIRGPIVDWYPYDFIDPHEVGGYGGVAMYSVAILVGFLLMAGFVVLLSRVASRQLRVEPALA